MNGFLDVMKTGVDRIRTGYKKNHAFYLKTEAIFGTFLIAGVTFTEAPTIHKAFKEAAKEWKEANCAKDKAVVVVDTAAKVALPVGKVVASVVVTDYCIEKCYEEQKTQIMTLAMMAAGSQIELDDLRAATKEVVGQKKAEQIEEKVAEKQVKRLPENIVYADMDVNNPDLILDTETGLAWHDKYLNVLDGIASYFTEAKTGNEVFYPWSSLYSHFNYNKDGNNIRVGSMLNDFGVMQSDLKNIKHAQDMIKLVSAGPNMYKMIRQVKKRPNPDSYIDGDGAYWDDDFYNDDDSIGDGDWNSSLNPELRA